MDYAKVKEKKSNFKNVCQVMTGKEVLIATANDLVSVDCMGTLYNVTDFCQKFYDDTKYLVRGFSDKESERAYCIFSSQAILKWECPTKGRFNCQTSAKNECLSLKPMYASSLDVFRSYYTEEGPDKILNCIYNGAKLSKVLE